MVGSVSTALFFMRIYGQPISFFFLWMLGSSIWLIFTFDHLMDAHRLKETAVSKRHKAHFKNRNLLTILLVFFGSLNATLVILHWDERFIKAGLAIAILMGLYFLIIHARGHGHKFKELFVALGATLGMCIMPWFISPVAIHFDEIMLTICFFVIHLINVLTFSRFDMRGDRINAMNSMVSSWNFKKISLQLFKLIAYCFLLELIFIFTSQNDYKINAALTLLLMLNLLTLINQDYYTFIKNERYRFWGDFIYLIPGLTLLISF